jgi:formate dehydrogenase gamma subunit
MSEAITRHTRYQRFSLSDRIEHFVQMLSFVVLALTGLVQKWPKNGLSEGIIDLLGGIESVRIIHRVFATILMIAVVYHFGAAGYRRVVLKQRRTMIPRKGDGRAIVQSIRHAIGTRDEPPEQGRFTWQEKVEYWSLMWGNVIMIVTGFLLWNPIATTQVLPGDFIPAAKSAHGNEAFLAVLAIAIWHMYHVHIKHWNTSIWNGYMSREEMLEYHPLELDAIESGTAPRPLEGEEKRRVATRYFSIYGGVAVILLIGIYFFVTFENTAIETIEPIEDVAVFAPVEVTPTTAEVTTTTEPATTTTVATAELSWDAFADPFASSCGGCHGDSGGMGGVSLTSYAGVSGVLTPGDPDGSLVVSLLEAGGHPGALDPEVLAALREWIAAGASES